MNVKKFIAPSSREALKKVRLMLGENAVILSNRNVDGQVEILAMNDQALTDIAPEADLVQKTSLTTQFNPRAKSSVTPASPIDLVARDDVNSSQAEIALMMNEIRSMRGMLENKMSEMSWMNTQQKSPHKADVLREMLATGLSASLSRQLIDKMPEGAGVEAGLDWVKSILLRNLTSISNENEILEQGGVYALVGPTGVGKTTTTAKLAARCVMRHGPSKLALITTDGYRIGGYEQLRIYGKILGVMVHSVKDEADLKIALAELKNKHTVLIDTVGVSQRDKMVTQQVAMLSGSGVNVKRLLCLNATSTGETLSEVVRAYQGSGLSGCILTKLDEAATIGGALDIVIRQKLNLYYVASGQRVPEDLHIANKQYLVDRAFRLKRETSSFKFQNDELPLLMSTMSSTPQVAEAGKSEELFG
ncbi:flagellar biosynthesis protein FlhF [Undibacterium seohonense]|jgi:flagellar biosynthesis protein FlhF|uniref:Flagellar biosynthesis protein FlhF n=1 Tax=Undibacterium seohonense TaxID=1344950 RepID=A0ABR6X787_9BURK|nr:flagellar biosynthesis protein FlhF [Undibacterium seohonense]MBC3808680.1 flagellar biosynthesis protein FlhF [Undibacterium seohonense]